MAGSEAEERIRHKVEAAMRARWPDARIIHELVLDTWKVRIDLAAVTRNHICVAEIKSERDTLKRLPTQVSAAVSVADEVWVVVADKHVAPLQAMQYADCPDLRHTKRFGESSEGLQGIELWYSQPYIPDPRARFSVLWASERRSAIAEHGAAVGRTDVCFKTLSWAVEHMSGAQIRRAVCAQLRLRAFPRADGALPRQDDAQQNNGMTPKDSRP